MIYVFSAFGVQLSMEKGERGKRVVWIGTEFELFPDKVVLGTPRKVVEDICDTLKAWDGKGMIPVQDLRTFLGKLAWVAGIVPRLKWTVTALYAILTKVQHEEQSEHERSQKRAGDQRNQRMKIGFVAVKRMGTTLPSLRLENMMIRTEPLEEVEPVWGVVTDASPRGIGGLLIHRVGREWHILEAFEAPAHWPMNCSGSRAQTLQASHMAAFKGDANSTFSFSVMPSWSTTPISEDSLSDHSSRIVSSIFASLDP